MSAAFRKYMSLRRQGYAPPHAMHHLRAEAARRTAPEGYERSELADGLAIENEALGVRAEISSEGDFYDPTYECDLAEESEPSSFHLFCRGARSFAPRGRHQAYDMRAYFAEQFTYRHRRGESRSVAYDGACADMRQRYYHERELREMGYMCVTWKVWTRIGPDEWREHDNDSIGGVEDTCQLLDCAVDHGLLSMLAEASELAKAYRAAEAFANVE